MPPDIMAISISKFSQMLGIYRSNIFFLLFSLLTYCLPFGTIILWARYYYIDKSLFVASEDLGLNKQSLIFKVVMPLSISPLISVFLFSFLLTFNEYPRIFSHSGKAGITEFITKLVFTEMYDKSMALFELIFARKQFYGQKNYYH